MVLALVEIPGAGIFSRPAAAAASAAAKNAGPLQYANCPKTEFPRPLTQLFVVPFSVMVAALDPNHIPTTALFGKVGSTGAIKLTPATLAS